MAHRVISARCRIWSLMGHSGHGPTCCWLDPVANDPSRRRFATANYRIAKGSFALDVGCLTQADIRGTPMLSNFTRFSRNKDRPIELWTGAFGD